MKTKQKRKTKFLRDDIANIILTDRDCKEYVERIVSQTLNINQDLIEDTLTLCTSRINANLDTKYSYVDALYENNHIIVNIEVNLYKSKSSIVKNNRYICHMFLKQSKIGELEKLKKIYQININNYDYFNKGEFIYKSHIIESKHHILRDDLITIIEGVNFFSG